jgi:hypothetical protein
VSERYQIREFEVPDAVRASFPDDNVTSVFKVWDTKEDRPVPFSNTPKLSAARAKCARLNARENQDG